MKKIIFLATFIFVFSLALPTSSFAQDIMGNIAGTNNTNLQNSDEHTARKEAEGKAISEKLEAKEINCESLTDDDFEVMGEYFMGQMMGTSHESMNQMMEQMTGKEGEEKMHIVMGKRMSGCDPNAQIPQNMMNIMPMMGNWNMNTMMNFGWWSWFGWIFLILLWLLIILGIIVLIKWLINQIRGDAKGKSALDILKERYAKGEISKEEFGEKKKDLT